MPAFRCTVGCAISIPCDVGDGAQVEAVLGGWGERFGGLDAVVHCAGITRDGVVWKMPGDAWRDVLRVNLDSAYHVVRGAIPLLRARDFPEAILNGRFLVSKLSDGPCRNYRKQDPKIPRIDVVRRHCRSDRRNCARHITGCCAYG